SERTPPPSVGWASSTTTFRPACASTIAAPSPLGPDPTTMASGVPGTEVGSFRQRAVRWQTGASEMGDGSSSYWYSRYALERSLALISLAAFLVAAFQFMPLLGSRGLTPAVRFIQYVPARESPSLFFLASSDAAFRATAWIGVALLCLALSGYPASLGTLASA